VMLIADMVSVVVVVAVDVVSVVVVVVDVDVLVVVVDVVVVVLVVVVVVVVVVLVVGLEVVEVAPEAACPSELGRSSSRTTRRFFPPPPPPLGFPPIRVRNPCGAVRGGAAVSNSSLDSRRLNCAGVGLVVT